MKKFTGIAGFLGSGRKNGFRGRSPAIVLGYKTLGVVGWFQVFLLSESGFSGFKDFQDLRQENGRYLAPAGRYVYRTATCPSDQSPRGAACVSAVKREEGGKRGGEEKVGKWEREKGRNI